jgi:hypothetical protein
MMREGRGVDACLMRRRAWCWRGMGRRVRGM